jgi:hypothetical protein
MMMHHKNLANTEANTTVSDNDLRRDYRTSTSAALSANIDSRCELDSEDECSDRSDSRDRCVS